jgi:uncharacterized delta-60 repeat protein
VLSRSSEMIRFKRQILSFLAMSFIATSGLWGSKPLFAADGDLDTSYNTPTGSNSVSFGASDNAYGGILQPDGKMIVVGGARNTGNGTEDFGAVRFNADGTLDTGFASSGKYALEITSGQADRATCVGLQSNGKIIIAGYTRIVSGNDDFACIRLTSAGVLDTTFGTSGITKVDFGFAKGDRCFAMVVQPDDSIVMTGFTTPSAGSDLDNGVVRLTASGALDSSFATGGKLAYSIGNSQDNPSCIGLQSDGKIIVASQTADSAGPFKISLFRLTTAGVLDATFGTSGVFSFNIPSSTSDSVSAMLIQSDDKIMLGGYSSASGNALIARVNKDGGFDTAFNTTGYNLIDYGSTSDQFLALVRQADGKYIAGGLYVNGTSFDSVLARVTTSGALDTTFGSAATGKVTIAFGANGDRINSLGLQSSGKIIAGGYTSATSGQEDFLAARFLNSAGLPATVTTNAATSVTASAATLNGTVNANSSSTTVTFEYGLSTNYGASVAATPSPVTGATGTAVSASLTGLIPGATYHYRCVGVNAQGTTNGSDQTFTTTAASTVSVIGSELSQYAINNILSNYTVPAGSNRLLVVVASDAASTAVTGVTFNSMAMTSGTSVNDGSIAVDSIWYLALGTSATPTTANIVMTSAGTEERFISAVTFSNVNQASPVAAGPTDNNLSGSASSLNVSSASGDVVLDVFDTYNPSAMSTLTIGAGQTFVSSRGGSVTSGGFAHYGTSLELGAATVTMSWTSNSTALLHATLNIKQYVNTAPTATNLSAVETYTEDTALNLTDIVVTDPDAGNTITATLTLSNVAAGSLNTATSGSVTSTYVAATGVWTAAGPIANVNTLLAGLTFTPASNFNANFTIATSVNDGIAAAINGNKIMNGTPVNDAPTATNLSAAETYTEDTALNLIDIVASDIDSASVTATLTLSVPAAGSLNTGTSGAVTSTYVAGTGVWTASGAIADVNTLLAGLTFTPTANSSTSFSITTNVSDGALSVSGSKTMTGTAVNDAPTATNLSAAETYIEDTTLNLVDIVASDIDSATLTATLTLSLPAAGSLTTATSGAVTSTYVAGTGVWSASGAIADVNTLLAGVSFVPAANFNSNFTITTNVSDGALSVSGSKIMTGTPVNDAPTATNLSAAETYTEDTALNLIDIVISDIDSANVTATLTLSVPAAGSLNTGTSGAVTSTYVAGTGVWTASGALANVNTLLAGLTFTPAANSSASFSITTNVSDGALSVSGSKTMTGTPVNDAPTATNLSAAETYIEDTTLNLTDIVASDIDSATLTATLTLSLPAAGSLTTATSGAVTSTYVAGTGVWTASGAIADVNTLLAGVSFVPAANFNSSFTITTNVSDGALSVSGSKSMTGTAVNDAPTATNLSAAETYTEDTALNLIDIVISDIDSANVTATLTLSVPAAGSLNTATSGAVTSTYVVGTGVWTASGALANVNTLLAGLTFTPALNYNSSFTISTSVDDGVAAAITGSKSMTGTAVNDAPTSTAPVAASTNEDTSLAFTGGNLLSVDDVDNANLSVTLTVSHGTLTMTTLSGLAFGSGDGTADATMTFTGTISNLNSALASLSFTPVADYNGSDTLSFSTSDSIAAPVVKNVALTINPVADIVADTVATTEEVAITFNAITGTNGASADNFEDAGRAVSSVTQGANGTVGFLADGTLTYTPNSNFFGTDNFTYTVSSGGVTETGNVIVNVTNVNDAPTSLAPATVSTAEDTAMSFNGPNILSVNDVDGGNLTVTLTVSQGALTMTTLTGLTFTVGDGTSDTTMTFSGAIPNLNTALASLSFTPTADYNGNDTLAFTTDDGIAAPVVKSVALTISAVSDIVADSVTTNEDTPITFNAITGTNGASADNFENAGRAVTSVTQGANGSVTFLANGSLTYTPAADFNGSDSFTYTVTSGGVTETASVSVTINAVSDIVNDALTTNEDAAITANVITGTNGASADNFENGAAAITSVTQGTNGSVTFTAGGNVTYTPNADFNGTDSFTYTVTSAGLTETGTVNVTITAIADIVNDALTTNEDTAITADVITGTNGASADSFEGAASITSVTQGTNGSVTFLAGGSVTYTPNADFNGSDSFTYTVTSDGVTETGTVNVTINAVTDAVTDSLTTIEDNAITANVLTGTNGASADNFEGLATVTAVTQGANGSVTFLATGSVTYTPNADYYGSDSFTYTVSSGGVNETGTVNVTISAVVDITNDALVTSEDIAVTANVITGTNGATADSFESGTAAITSVTQGANGSVTFLAGGSVTYTPTTGFNGSDSFTYTVTSNGATETATVNVTVNPHLTITTTTLPDWTVNQAGYSQSIATIGGTGTITFSSTGSLPIGLTLTAGGLLSGTPTTTGTFNFDVTVTDTVSDSDTQSYTVVINPAVGVSPPTLPDGTVYTAYNQTVSMTGGTGSPTFAVTAGALPTGLSLNTSSGAITGNPTATGAFNFTITATDAVGASGSQAYTVNMAAPTLVIAPATLTAAKIGVAYNQQLSGSGGIAPYTFVLSSGALPAGITLSSNGLLSGTPTAAGNFAFDIDVTDASTGTGPYSNTQTFALTVNAPTITLSPATLLATNLNVAYSQTLTASGGTAPYTFAVTAGTLPTGLSLSSAGVISGSASVEGIFNFTITATDSSTGTGPFTASSALSILVNRVPVFASGPLATPNPAIANQPVVFSVSATDADQDALTYTWDFKDGSTSTQQNPTHPFTVPGTYVVSVTVDDGHGATLTATVSVEIHIGFLGEGDADKDGFADEIEAALGSDPFNATSTPAGFTAPKQSVPITNARLYIRMNFVQGNSDQLVLMGRLPLASALPGGTRMIVDIGGIVKIIELSSTGRAQGNPKSISVRIRASGKQNFRLQFNKDSFTKALEDEKLTATVVRNEAHKVSVSILLLGVNYNASVPQTYWSNGLLGRTKTPK